MAKIKVKVRFRDKIDHITWYEVGKTYEFSEARAKFIIGKGWAEVVASPVLVNVKVFGKEFDKAVVLEAMKTIKEGTNPIIGVENLKVKIEKLDDEKKSELKTALGVIENPDPEQKGENVELLDGTFIGIVSNADGTRTAYGEGNGEKVLLASGEYSTSSLVYVVKDGVIVEELEPEK